MEHSLARRKEGGSGGLGSLQGMELDVGSPRNSLWFELVRGSKAGDVVIRSAEVTTVLRN